jgi:hypothetical protein
MNQKERACGNAGSLILYAAANEGAQKTKSLLKFAGHSPPFVI